MTSEEGRLVGGRYRLDRRIGSGAMGVVWQAYDERLLRAVAVKQLRLEPGLDPEDAEEARERAMREGRIAARLHHPNAVSVFDVVDEDDAPWLVMEYVPSRSLAAEMSERGVLQPDEVGRIGAQVAHALVAAHAAGIVHRDIKPANVLLGESGQVKITDFGISRAQGDVAVTKTGLIAGTPAYLAPEVAYGRPPEAPADVFSLGSTLYAAVEGEPPFGMSENTLGLLHAVAAGRINPPQQAGILTDVLIALLNPEPEARPSSTVAARWLDQVARGQLPDVRSPGTLSGMAAATQVASPYNAPTVADRTRAVTTVGGYGATRVTGPRPGTGARPPVAPFPERRNRRPFLVAGISLAAVAVLAIVLLLSGALDHNPPTTPQQVTNTGPTQPSFQQVPEQVTTTYSPPPETLQRTQEVTTTTPPETTTTTTTTATTTTTTATTTTTTTTAATSTPAKTSTPTPTTNGAAARGTNINQ